MVKLVVFVVVVVLVMFFKVLSGSECCLKKFLNFG